MRDFFIAALEVVIHIVVVLMGLAILAFAAAPFFTAPGFSPVPGVSPILASLMILIGGTLYLILTAGFLYLGLGIYQNTKRAAAALEDLRSR